MKIGLLSLLLILLLLFVAGCTKQVQEEKEQVKLEVPDITQKIKATAIVIDKDYCESDDDCACGMSLETADCYVGNRDYIDADTYIEAGTDLEDVTPTPKNDSERESRYLVRDGSICRNFCGGEVGQLEINCVSNKCVRI